MTLTTTVSSVEYVGNGATTVFPWVNFRIDKADDLQVVLIEIATSIETLVVPGLYSATGFGLNTGGSVTYPLTGSPLAATHKLRIQRQVAATQDLDILNQSGFLPEVVEQQLDRIVMQIQQLNRIVSQISGGIVGGGALPTAGGVMTGPITMTNNARIIFDGPVNNHRRIDWYTSGKRRWEFGAGQSAESGGNVGSDFSLNSYDDAGAYLSTPFFIRRSTGNMELYGALLLQKTFGLQNIITPPQITADQTDYAPTNHADSAIMRLSSNGYWTINSLAGGFSGRVLFLYNIGNNTIALAEDDGVSGAAANRIKTASGLGTEIFPGSGAILVYDGTSSRWRVVVPNIASAGPSQMEGASSTISFVTPGFQHRHPGHPKAWALVTVSGGTPTLAAGYGVSGIVDTGVGQLTVNWTTPFSSANYNVIVSGERASTNLGVANLRNFAVRSGGRAAGSVLVECWDGTATTALAADPASWNIVAHGDQ